MKPNIATEFVKKLEEFNGDIGAHKEIIGKLMVANELWRKQAIDFEEMYKQEHREKNELKREVERQAKEIERQRIALEFYADPATYDIEHLDRHGYIIIDKDAGERAREALRQ